MSFLCVGLFGLKFHIGICNLRNIREVEHNTKKEYKARDGQVDPLYILQCSSVVERKEDVGA